MSSKNSAGRGRLALLAGSSLGAALLSTGAAVLAPTAALAANECGGPPASGTYVCQGPKPTGVTYTTSGNLILQLANDLTVGATGVAVTGVGANTVTINRVDLPLGAATDPAITGSATGIQVLAGTGAVNVDLVDATGPGVVITGVSAGVELRTAATASTALQLRTTNGQIRATGPTGVGVLAETTSVGAGNLVLNLGGGVEGQTAIQATTRGTGNLTVNLYAVGSTQSNAVVAGGDVAGGSGPAILIAPNANATITVGAGRVVRADGAASAVIEASSNATRTFTINNDGTIRSGDSAVSDLAVRGTGAGAYTIVNGREQNGLVGEGMLIGRLDFAAATGAVTLNNTGFWRSAGLSSFGSGDTTLANLEAVSIVSTNIDGAATTLDFGAGADLFRLYRGTLAVGEGTPAAATLTIAGLENWVNGFNSRILFGVEGNISDGVANDHILAPGVYFTGESALYMDVALGGVSQASCAALTAADCLSLTGGQTGGVHQVTVRDSDPSAPSAYNPGGIVLVDVSGAGTSAADHFRLSNGSAGWRPDNGSPDGVIDKGLFFYDLVYDETAKKHMLVGLPDGEALQFTTFGLAAQTVWRATTGTWFDRQGDLRNTLEGRDGASPGAWLKITGNFTDRELVQSHDLGGGAFEFSNGYDQWTTAVVGGVDLVNIADGASAWVAGLTAGVVNSEVTFKTSATEVTLEGSSLGAYASYAGDRFFLDAIVNANSLDVEHVNPTLGVAPTPATGELDSLGGQLEGGVRLTVPDTVIFLEPLFALAYVKTDLSDFTLPGAVVDYDEQVSLRGALGGRVSGDLVTQAATLKFSATGRIWEEFDGENGLTLVSGGQSLAFTDDFGGALGDFAVGLSVFSGGLSAIVNYGVTFRNEYYSTDATLGFRYQW